MKLEDIHIIGLCTLTSGEIPEQHDDDPLERQILRRSQTIPSRFSLFLEELASVQRKFSIHSRKTQFSPHHGKGNQQHRIHSTSQSCRGNKHPYKISSLGRSPAQDPIRRDPLSPRLSNPPPSSLKASTMKAIP